VEALYFRFGTGKRINKFPSVVDLDPYPDWIHIRIRNPDLDPGGQKWPLKTETFNKFHLSKSWMFSFEG
jgi:hypothetical protein